MKPFSSFILKLFLLRFPKVILKAIFSSFVLMPYSRLSEVLNRYAGKSVRGATIYHFPWPLDLLQHNGVLTNISRADQGFRETKNVGWETLSSMNTRNINTTNTILLNVNEIKSVRECHFKWIYLQQFITERSTFSSHRFLFENFQFYFLGFHSFAVIC